MGCDFGFIKCKSVSKGNYLVPVYKRNVNTVRHGCRSSVINSNRHVRVSTFEDG